ncbi:hypothetical protein BC936DRAFT_146099 [Jimgerdemannia flammicorona]|uniref:Uncharacterized protein n=1 Tax=Jimgerdemannia flammicorona TaxID=994334 RepID=A0A433D8G4_9FUNG|nr:hypothetical protein BC936DRAFT_146099 [Jimgerdemannia flammicorona]
MHASPMMSSFLIGCLLKKLSTRPRTGGQDVVHNHTIRNNTITSPWPITTCSDAEEALVEALAVYEGLAQSDDETDPTVPSAYGRELRPGSAPRRVRKSDVPFRPAHSSATNIVATQSPAFRRRPLWKNCATSSENEKYDPPRYL